MKLVRPVVSFWSLTVMSLIFISGCDSSPIQHLGISKDYQRTPSEFISATERKIRHATIADLYYELNLDLTQFGRYAGIVEFRFVYQRTEFPLTIDFADGEIERILLNNKPTGINYNGEFLSIPAEQMNDGNNRIKIQFSRPFVKNKPGLNHFFDSADGSHYLFNKSDIQTAHALFPMFNQDDLPMKIKAIFTTDNDWNLLSTLDTEKVEDRGDFKLWYFQTERFKTSQFTLHAGQWHEWKGKADDKQVSVLVRKSIKERIPLRRWFQGIQQATKTLDDYFDTDRDALQVVLLPGLFDYHNSTQDILSLSELPMLYDDHISPAWHELLTRHEVDNRLALKPAQSQWTSSWVLQHLTSELFPTYLNSRSINYAHRRHQPGLAVLSNQYPDSLDKLTNRSLHQIKGRELMTGLEQLANETSVNKAVRVFLNQTSTSAADLLEAIDTEASFSAIDWSSEWLNKPGIAKLTTQRQCDETGSIVSLTINQVPMADYPVIRPLKVTINHPSWRSEAIDIDMTSGKKVLNDLPDMDCDAALIISTNPNLLVQSDNTSSQLRQLTTNHPELDIYDMYQLAIDSENDMDEEEVAQWLHLIRVRLEYASVAELKAMIDSIKHEQQKYNSAGINDAYQRLSDRLYQLSLNTSKNADYRIAWFSLHIATLSGETQLNRILAWLFGNAQPHDLQSIPSLQLAVIKHLAQANNPDIKLILDSFASKNNVLYRPYLASIRTLNEQEFSAVDYLQNLLREESENAVDYATILFNSKIVDDPEAIAFSLENLSQLERVLSTQLLQNWLEPVLLRCDRQDSLASVNGSLMASEQWSQLKQATRDWIDQVGISCQAKKELGFHY